MCHRVILLSGSDKCRTFFRNQLTGLLVALFKNLKAIYQSMNWIILILAGLFEVGFTTCLGKARETSALESGLWLAGFFISLTLSMLLLYKATLTLPMGTAYAVWTGIGAVGTAIIGIFFFREPVHFWRLFFICSLIASIVGLKFVSH
jgi:quaternary ammonium compound-resistance protein SugE